MRKVILTICLVFLYFTVQISSYSKDTTVLKNFNVTELPDSIELNVDSEEPVPYSIINYSDGSKGVKFNNANLNTEDASSNNIKIFKKVDIQDASLINDNLNSVELKLSGNSNLADKKINIHNNVSKSGVIIIEPEHENYSYVNKVSSNLPQLNFVSPPKRFINSSFGTIRPDKSEENVPISMYTEKQDSVKSINKENQAKQKEKIKDILNLNKATDTETPSYNPYETEPDLSSYSSNREIAQNTVQDPLNNSSTSSNAQNTTNNDFFSLMKDFVGKNIIALSGGFGCCVVIVILVLVIVVLKVVQSSPKQDIQNNISQDQMNSVGNSSNIIDNDPVNYIPPKPESSSQSVSDAISKIIDIKNNKDKS